MQKIFRNHILPVDTVDNNNPELVQGPVIAYIHVSTRQPEVVKYFLSIRIFSEPQQPLCGEEHARHVGEVHHHVGLVAVGEVDTPHGHYHYHYHHYIKHVSDV